MRCRPIRASPARTPPTWSDQLRLWKRGLAPQTDTDAIMAPIARALSERQIEDVSAYFASCHGGTGWGCTADESAAGVAR